MSSFLETMDDSVLPLVSKPGQYLSPLTEPVTPRVRAGGGSLCLLDPRPLGRAFSCPELHTVLSELNARLPEKTGLDLALAPAPDLLERLEAGRLPWVSLGARRPLGSFPVLLVHAVSPVLLPLALRLLTRAGIPTLPADRGADHPVLVLAGPVVETLRGQAPWFDAVLLGHPEAFCDVLAAWVAGQGGDRGSRRDWSEAATRHSGVLGWTRMDHPETVVEARWSGFGLSAPVLLPAAAGEALEYPVCISRRTGRTVQYRAAEAIAREVESLVVETGVGEIVLAGPDASEHPDLVPLLEQLNRRFEGHDVQIRLEAVSLGSLSPAMARELHKGSRHQLVFAPVAPSERLRRVAGRPLTREAFLERAELARRGGWGTVQFQIEVGRPGETPDDLDEAAQTLEAVRAQQTRSGSAPRMSVTLVPFVPSAEDEPGSVSAAERLTEVAEAWRQRWRSRRIRVGTAPALPGLARAAFRNATSPEHLMDALQSLAPKALADLEVLEPQAWLACLRAAGVSVPAAPDRPHPVLDWNESGIPSGGTGFDSRQPETEPTEAPAELGPPAWMVGRRPRRTGRGRGTRQSERYRVRFSKSDSLRLSAHLDITRAFDRAFRRTQLPVAQTQGKDRKPKVSFGPPLPLGMTSAAEYFDITFSREVPESYVRILNEALPEGLSVVASAPVRTEPKSLNAAIQIADYEVSFSDSLIRDHLDGMDFDSLKDRLAQAAAGALAANTLEVTKVRGETSKTFNARPSLLKADVVRDDGGRPVLGLRLTLNLPDSVRPETLTARLCSWADFDERLLRVHRAGLYIPGRQKLLDPLEVVAPDFAWWRHPVRGGTVL